MCIRDRNGAAGHGHSDHVLLSGFQTLTDGLGDLSGLAQTIADLDVYKRQLLDGAAGLGLTDRRHDDVADVAELPGGTAQDADACLLYTSRCV